MPSNKTHRAFRIDNDLWNEFTDIADREGITATKAITDFIQSCIKRGSTQWVTGDEQPPSGVNTLRQKTVITKQLVNTDIAHHVNTLIAIKDVNGLTETLAQIERNVNTQALTFQETVTDFKQQIDDLYKQFNLLKTTQTPGPVKVEDLKHTQPDDQSFVNTQNVAAREDVTQPTITESDPNPTPVTPIDNNQSAKNKASYKKLQIANRPLPTPDMLPEQLATLVTSYLNMGMLIGDVSIDFFKQNIPNPYGGKWSIKDVKNLLREYLPK